MPRPTADLPDPGQLRALIRDGALHLRVTPGARTEGIVVENDRILAKVRAKPTDGEANAAVEKLVARALGLPTSRCRIVRGATSREKVLRIAD